MQPSVPVFVGLDYSQHAVQVCVLDAAGTHIPFGPHQLRARRQVRRGGAN